MPRTTPPRDEEGTAQSKLYIYRPEVEAIIIAIPADEFRDLAMISAGFDTGQRVQDLMLGVWWRGLDLDARVVHEIYDHKKDKWRGGIPFSPRTEKYLRAYLKAWEQWHPGSKKPSKEDHVFGISPQWAREVLHKYMRAATVDGMSVEDRLRERARNIGILKPKLGWHLCRHTFCRLLLAEHGDNPRSWKILSQVTGDRISTLMETYSDFTGEQLGELMFEGEPA